MSLKTLTEGVIYKKSRDEMKLELYNSSVDHARKYKFVELTQKEKDFKRKYSWCLQATSNPVQRRKSANTHRAKPKSKRLQRSQTQPGPLSTESQFCKSDSGKDIEESDKTKDDSLFSNCKILHQSAAGGACGRPKSPVPPNRRVSIGGGELPSLVASRRKSLLDVDCNDRVSYLEDLWNRVFSSDPDNNKQSKRQNGRQEQTLKQTYTGIVMQQFESSSSSVTSENATAQLPDIHKRDISHLPKVRSKLDSTSSSSSVSNGEDDESGINGNLRGDDAKDDEQSDQQKTSSVSSPKSDASRGNQKQTDKSLCRTDNVVETDVEGCGPKFEERNNQAETGDDVNDLTKQQQPPQRRARRKTVFSPILKPPFQTVGRPRSLSLDFEIHSHLWRAANFNLLASRRTGEDRFMKCVRLAMARDKISTLQGKKWRDDLKRCRYLRIPKDSAYLSPINSDPED